MKYLGQATLIAFLIAAPAVVFGQGAQDLSITNYQVVSQQQGFLRVNVTYRAELVNSGGASFGSVTATLTSLNPFSFKVVPGQDTLTFSPVPAKSHVTSINTFTILIDPKIPFDFANLQWTFQTTLAGPVANAGPPQAAKVGTIVMLDGTGSTNPPGIGTLAYKWSFTSRPGGSQAQLMNPTSVMPSFLADVAGDYVILLTVSSGLGSSSASVVVSTVYTPPVANAGPNQSVVVGSTVVLNGSGSTDVNGAPLTYSWILAMRPPGSTAILIGPRNVSPTFIADKPGTYVARLVVNDTKTDSNPASVTITTQNSPPVANAGPNQFVTFGALVQLNGAGSTDVDGDPLTYKWSLISKPAPSTAVLSNPSDVNPTFTVNFPGTYVAQLIVNDGKVDSTPTTVIITTDPVLPPVANAGSNQTVVHRTLAMLSGFGTDPHGFSLTFQWALLSKPIGSTASLSSPTIPNPTFLADVPGTYVAQLIVNNGFLNSAPSTVTITTTNTPPVAAAGPNQNVIIGANVTLDGSASFDADRDPLTYSWSLLSRPEGSTVTLTAANTVSPMFAPDVVGTYVAQLIVNDGFANSLNPATVTITVLKKAVITVTPNPLNMSTAAPGTLTVTVPAPAGAGGQVITLTSFNESVASVPATVTIDEGNTGINVPVTPGGTGGSTVIFATAPGFQPGFATVNVVIATITVTMDSGNVGLTRTINGSINLSAPAPVGGLIVALSATPGGILDVQPPTVTIAGGSTTGTFMATGVGLGSAVLTASSPGFSSGVSSLNVVLLGHIVLPANSSAGLNQSAPLLINLVTPAPAGGVTIILTSDDPSRVSITPSSVFIPFKATSPVTQPTFNGLNLGSANITASAPGFTTSNSTLVQVTASLGFLSPNVVINTGTAQTLILTLSGPAPIGGLTVNLSSDNPDVATVPQIISFQPLATTVNVPVMGVAAGSTLIHASLLPNIADISASVTVH